MSPVKSGSAWPDSLPNGWAFERIGQLFDLRNSVTTGALDAPLSVTKAGVIEQLDQVALSVDGAPKKLVELGDIVINSRSDRKGSAGVAPRRGSVSVISTVLTPRSVDPRYAHHVMRSIPFQEEFYRYGSGIVADLWSTRWSEMKSISLPVPNVAEQRTIADFLDHETAEIDALVADLEVFRSLSAERHRNTVISEISGQSLSGTERLEFPDGWIENLPSDWSIQRMSWLFAQIGSGTTPRADDTSAFGDEIAWVTTGELREKPIRSTVKYLNSSALQDYSALKVYPPGSLMIAMYGATIGRLGWLNTSAAVNQAVCVFSGYKFDNIKYPFYVLFAAREHLLNLASGGGQPNINQEKLKALRIPVPPNRVQNLIIEAIETHERDFEQVDGDIRLAITLAKERRAALISAAVTGQIDVTTRQKPAVEQLEDDIAQGVHTSS